MEIRKAQADDAQVLTHIAHAAKRYWGYPDQWLSLWKDALTITPDFILQHEVYAATEEDQIIGFYALGADSGVLTLEHLWISPERIGIGVGRQLFEHAVWQAISHKARLMNIEADPHAEGFYQRMGATRIGGNVVEIEGRERVLPLLQVDLSRIAEQHVAADAQSANLLKTTNSGRG